MECSACEGDISKKERDYSIKNYGKTLCRDCQKKYGPLKQKFQKKKERSTPEATKLYEILIKMGFDAKIEQWDKHKHIDIAIPKLKVNIEVDGGQHNFSEKQALADLKRTYYSFKKGYFTLRIPNNLIQNNAYETAKYIKQLLESSEKQLEDELNKFDAED